MYFLNKWIILTYWYYGYNIFNIHNIRHMKKNYINNSFEKINAVSELISFTNKDIIWVSWSINTDLKISENYGHTDLWDEEKHRKVKIKNWTLASVTWSYKVDKSRNLFSLYIETAQLQYNDKQIPLNGLTLELTEKWDFKWTNDKITLNKFQLAFKNKVIKFNKTITEKPRPLLKTRYKFALILLWILVYESITYSVSNKFKWDVNAVIDSGNNNFNYQEEWVDPIWDFIEKK